MKVLNFQECIGSTSSMQSTSKLAFYITKLHCTSFLESFWWVPKTSSEFLFFSALEHPPLYACEFLFFSSFFPFFFFCQQLLSFSLSHVALSSLSLKKKDPNFMERHEMEDLRAERERMQRVTERHARRRRFTNFFLMLWFEPWKPWTVFSPGRFNHGSNG